MELFSLNSNPEIAQRLRITPVPLWKIGPGHSDGETKSILKMFVDMIFISFNQPVSVNNHLMELLIMEMLANGPANTVVMWSCLTGYTKTGLLPVNQSLQTLVANMLVAADRVTLIPCSAGSRFLRY